MQDFQGYADLVSLFPPGLLEDLAVQHKVDSAHEIRLPGPVAFVLLLNAVLNGSLLSQRMLEEAYNKQTGKTLDHSTLGKYLARVSPAFFQAVYAFLYENLASSDKSATLKSAEARACSALRIRRVDATIVALSAKLMRFGIRSGTRNTDKERRQVKTVVELTEGGLPSLLRVCKDQSESSDCIALGNTMVRATSPRDVWVFDKGCHSRERMLAIHEAHGFFVTPHTNQSLHVLGTVWQANPTANPTAGSVGEPSEEPSGLCSEGGPNFRLLRIEHVFFENSYSSPLSTRLKKMRMLALHGLRYDKKSKSWKPLVLLTNLPLSEDRLFAGPFTFLEVADLYRSRWEIEVLFRFMKQNLGYAHLLSRDENGITVMVYMSLIAALLLIWYKRMSRMEKSWKAVKFWFQEDIREWTRDALQSIKLLSG